MSFAPVPTASKRHDGWTPDRQRAFVAALAEHGLVSAAAKVVGMSARSAYRLRQRPGAEGFAAAWDAALAETRLQARSIGIGRALYGVKEPVFHAGKQVGTRTRFDDRLMLALLRNPPRAPGARARDEAAARPRAPGGEAPEAAPGFDRLLADLRDLRDFPEPSPEDDGPWAPPGDASGAGDR